MELPSTAPADVHHAASERLTLVLPAYNEAGRIGPALDELFAYLGAPAAPAAPAATSAASSAELPAEAALPPRIRVLVVDDGSTDRTAHLVLDRPEAAVPEDAPIRLELLRVPHGGKGAAVRAGMLAADGDVIVFADADMATPPDQLPKLLEALAEADVALGSRIQPDGSDMRASQPSHRRLLGRVFHALAAIWVTGGVEDTQCGFKGFRREAAREIFSRQAITSIVFDVELIHLARRLHCRVAVVPIRWADRRGSRMRPGPRLALRVAWDLFRIPLVHRRVRG
jgi:dolichyl-phosphate beta-glucosyltransferase